MPADFDSRKQAILTRLGVPDGDYTDASPKGSVDAGVRELVDDINRLEGFVTTSSCAGRVAVYQDGRKLPDSAMPPPQTASDDKAPLSGKGGGKWLFVSHEPLDLNPYTREGSLFTNYGLLNAPASFPANGHGSSTCFVHFKFEPLILHILTSSNSKAQQAVSAALAAGFRESGITGALDSESGPRMVAIRTTGLALDSIVAYVDDAGEIRPMVSEQYLQTITGVANDRFEVNERRKQRLWSELKARTSACDLKGQDGWEPADVRRARKRAEGQHRQRLLRQDREGSVLPMSQDGFDEDVALGMLMGDNE